MSSCLLPSKLFIPPANKNLIPRPRLVQILNDALEQDCHIILVSAPAGYGKTTLVTEWLRGVQAKTAWLSLDKADNDPTRFLTYLINALQQVDPSIGRASQAMLQSPQPLPPEALITPLIHDITNIPTAFHLVLEDYHVIETPLIHQQLDFLVENQPPNAKIVIITREDPPFRLARLRAQGLLVEIRRNDLRFTVDECAEFLQKFHLARKDIMTLEHCTEGWIAGLQLAALSLQGCDDIPGFIQTFSGSSHFVLDLLIEEVFDQLPAEEQDFLLKTSILDRLTGPLCDVVANRTSSQFILDRLEHSNLFIIPLDPTRTWYRYHHLFADLLQQRLHSFHPQSEKGLHSLASQWFTSEGYFAEAIQHALAAADWDTAARLIQDNSVQLLERGELITLLSWLKALPEDVFSGNPQLCRDYGWTLTLTNHLDAAGLYLDCAERAYQGDNHQLGQVIVAQAYLARARGDFPKAIILAKQAMELILPTDILHRSLATFTLGFALTDTGRFGEAEAALLEACDAARTTGNDYTRLTALGLLGGIQKMQGRLRRGAEFCQQAVEEAHGSPAAAQVQVFLASIQYEWNDLDAAENQLGQALIASQYLGNRAIELTLLPVWARVQIARGNPAAVLDRLSTLHQLTVGYDTPRTRASIAFIRADIGLLMGDISSASYWMQKTASDLVPSSMDLPFALLHARLFLEKGQHEEAGQLLSGIYEQVAQAGMLSNMIEIRTLQAQAAATASEAIRFLTDALTWHSQKALSARLWIAESRSSCSWKD